MTDLKFDIDYSTQIAGDYPAKLRAFAGGELKLFFVPSVRYGREIVELIQRTGVEYETVTYDRAWDLNKWGIGDYYDVRAAIGDFRAILDNLERVLTSDRHFDVMVIPGVNGWAHFSKAARQAILRRVSEGAGLVLIKPFHGAGMEPSEELTALSPLVNRFEEVFGDDPNAGGGFPVLAFDRLLRDRWVPESHYITDGIPFGLFPYGELAYYPYESNGETILRGETGQPIAAVKAYGKGRVAAFGYYPRDILPQHSEFTGKESTFDAIIENWGGARQSPSFAYLEYAYEMIYRSIVWTANRVPDIRIQSLEEDNGRITVRTSEAADRKLAYTVKNAIDEVVAEGTTAGHAFELPQSLKAGGAYRVEVGLMEADRLLDWGTLALDYATAIQIAEAEFGADVCRTGDRLDSSFRLRGAADGELRISVVDDFDRILAISRHDLAGQEEVRYAFTVPAVRSMYIRIRAELYMEGTLAERIDSPRKVVTPEERALNDFEVFMCPQNRGHGEWLPLVGHLFREMGITGLFPGSPRTLTMSGAKGLGVYWYHRGPYAERKENYLRTKDKAYLQRTPCLNDPALWSELEERIKKTVNRFKAYGPVSYFANDEGSITCYSDELDLCFCPHCMNGMRSWLQDEYGSLERLNRVWRTSFAAWEDVIPYTLEEAQSAQSHAPWTDHRRFMERTFTSAYEKIGTMIREADPDGVIRMSGCQASTAFTGYDYYQLHRYVGYFEAYGVGNQFEFHRSFARPDTIIGGWFGYGAEGVGVRNSIWSALFHNLTLISIFWEYSCLNPDFTYSRSARDMSQAFLEIRREGIGKLLLYGAKRDSLGIAVHYSMHAIHGAHLRRDTTRYEANRQGWIDLLEDTGYQYNFVASQQIEAGELIAAGYKLLILPYSIALSDREAEQVAKFAEYGGTVLGDMQTGIMDEHGVLSDRGKLDELFGIERLNTEARPFYINKGFKTNAAFPYFDFNLAHIPGREDEESGLVMAEIGTRTRAGIAAYSDDFLGTVASVIVKEHGNGKGLYLNLGLDGYPHLRQNGGGFGLRELIRHMMGFAGVRKPATIRNGDGEPIEHGYESVYYADGSALYVCLQSKPDARASGHDGLAVGPGKTAADREERLSVELAQQGHVYNIREKRYLGYTNRVEASLSFGDSLLLAVLPHRVERIAIDMPDSVRRGETLQASIRIETDAPDIDYRQVLSIGVHDPEGDYAWLYSDNRTVSDRRSELSIAIPYNEKKGRWTVTVKEVATGVSSSAVFEVE